MERGTQRWFKSFDSAPLDGTPFCVPLPVRYNPYAKCFEVVAVGEGDHSEWKRVEFTRGPSSWCNLLPVGWELPSQTWFAVQYKATLVKLTRWQRFKRRVLRLFDKLPSARAFIVRAPLEAA